MALSRKRALAGGAAAGAFASIAVLRWPAGAAQFTLKLANDQVATHPMNVSNERAAKRIRDASNGQLEIGLFPNSLLGGDTQMLAQLRSGAIDLMQSGNNVLGNVIPAAALLSIPFAFTSQQHYQAAADGPLGAYIGGRAARIGLRAFPTTFYGGFFDIQNRLRPIDAPGDLRGLKLRVPPGPIDVGTFKAFDASPTVITLGEVYTSLQAHLIDGIEVPLPTLQNFKFYEQVKFCSLTQHSALAYLVLANADTWRRLPKNLRDLLDREFDDAAKDAAKLLAAQEATIQSTLTGEGMVFNRPALEPFGRVLRNAGFYRQLRDQSDPQGWDALEKATGKLT